MTDPDLYGPIDVLIIEFPGGADGAATAKAIGDLVDRGTVRLYDLMVVTTAADGSGSEVDLSAAAGGPLSALARFAGARSGLLGAEDVAHAVAVLEPGTAGLVLLYENSWAIPFAGAAWGEGGRMVSTARIPAQEIMDALDAAEAAD